MLLNIWVAYLQPCRDGFFNQHDIHPVGDRVYGFEEARLAYEHLARGAFGTIVIEVKE